MKKLLTSKETRWTLPRAQAGLRPDNENDLAKAIVGKAHSKKMLLSFMALCTLVSAVPLSADVEVSQKAQSLAKVNDETVKNKTHNGHANKHVHHASNEKIEMKNHQHQEGDWMFSDFLHQSLDQ